MKEDELQVIPPDPVKHTDEMFDMCSKVFSRGGGYFHIRHWCEDSYVINSHYDWDASRIGLIDGRIVTHWGAWNYTMRIGTARVKTSGPGLVATHADYRRRGLMVRTAQASIERMRELSYDMSIISGIAGFYDQFGYAIAWAQVNYTIEAHNLPTDKPRHRLHKFAPRHREDLARLYNRENATRTGTAVRPTYLRNQKPDRWVGYLWKDRTDKPVGYVIVARAHEDLECVECCGDDAEILAVLTTLTRRWHCKHLCFGRLHYHHPLRKRIVRGVCMVRTRHLPSGGVMVRTINLKSTLTKMEKELSRRLKNSNLSGWRGSILLSDAREKVSLVIDRSCVKVAAPARSKHRIAVDNELGRLLVGGDEPGEVVEVGRMKLTGDAFMLVEALFPNQHPMLDAWDQS